MFVPRRAFCLGTFALATTGARSVRASSTTTPKILIAGDSMVAGGFGMFLERALRKQHEYDVVRRGVSSTGLARPDFFNWPKAAKALVADRQPDATVVMFGGNDVQGLYMGGGKWIRWGEPGWAKEYARRVNTIADIVSPQSQNLFWVGLPIMRANKFRGRCRIVNTIFRAEMALRRNAWFIDSWDLFTDGEGNFVDKQAVQTNPDVEPKVVRVRSHDGIHLSAAGAGVLKRHVLATIVPLVERSRAHAD